LRQPRAQNPEARAKAIDLAIQAVVIARRNRIETRFKANWSAQKIDGFARQLGNFAAFESQFMHSLLVVHPNCQLSEMQSSMWHRLAETRCWVADKKHLSAWVASQRSKRRPLLIRVTDESRSGRKWPPQKPDGLEAMLSQFAVLDAAPADLAYIACYLNSETLTFPSGQTPAFLAATSKGDVCRLVSNRDSNRDLFETLGPILEREEYRR
jgi:hypothetical protein